MPCLAKLCLKCFQIIELKHKTCLIQIVHRKQGDRGGDLSPLMQVTSVSTCLGLFSVLLTHAPSSHHNSMNQKPRHHLHQPSRPIPGVMRNLMLVPEYMGTVGACLQQPSQCHCDASSQRRTHNGLPRSEMRRRRRRTLAWLEME